MRSFQKCIRSFRRRSPGWLTPRRVAGTGLLLAFLSQFSVAFIHPCDRVNPLIALSPLVTGAKASPDRASTPASSHKEHSSDGMPDCHSFLNTQKTGDSPASHHHGKERHPNKGKKNGADHSTGEHHDHDNCPVCQSYVQLNLSLYLAFVFLYLPSFKTRPTRTQSFHDRGRRHTTRVRARGPPR